MTREIFVEGDKVRDVFADNEESEKERRKLNLELLKIGRAMSATSVDVIF